MTAGSISWPSSCRASSAARSSFSTTTSSLTGGLSALPVPDTRTDESSCAAGSNGQVRPLAREGEQSLIAAIGRGDEEAFAQLLDRHSSAMVRVAMAYVPSRATAEEV